MATNGDTQGALPSLNDIISPEDLVEPTQISYQKITNTQKSQPAGQTNYSYTRKVQEVGNPSISPIEEEAEITENVTRKVVTYQQPVTESTYYEKKVTTKTTTSGRGNEGQQTQTTMTRYSNTNANKNQPNTYTRPGQTATSTTTTTTVQRGQYGQGRGTPASTTTTTNTTSQVYRDRGNQKNVKPPTKIGNSQSYSGNRNQPKRPDASANYKPKARSPEPGTLKRKTINRGKPVENIQITHIIFSSRPTDFHITEELNLDNLNSGPIKISQSDRARLKRSGKVVSTCSCDGVEIAKPRKVNLKGNTTHYQHARGIGMTDDRKDNINPMFYSSEIKKLDPIYKPKEKEKVEYIEIFRSSGQVRSKSPTTTKTMTKTTTNYNMGGGSKYTQNQNYRSGATKTSTNNRGDSSSTSGRGATNTTSNRGGVGTTVRTTSNYTRTTNTGGASGRDGEIIKETNTKVQMGSRSFKNQSQPTTYTTTERKVYNQKSFFKNN